MRTVNEYLASRRVNYIEFGVAVGLVLMSVIVICATI